jgi:hypothetical protein
MNKKLTFDETVCVAINSVAEGLLDRPAAVKMITDAAGDLVNGLEKTVYAAALALERAVEEYRKANTTHPLDEMTLEDAANIYQTKGMLLYCRDGHAVTMFREVLEHNEPLAVCQ